MDFRLPSRRGHVHGNGVAATLRGIGLVIWAVAVGEAAGGLWGSAQAQEPTLAAPTPIPLQTVRVTAAPRSTPLKTTPAQSDDRQAVRLASDAGLRDQEESQPASPLPPPAGLALDEVIQLCLLNDPKIRAGFEAIRQSQADWKTASLCPNPELMVAGVMLPLSRRYTVEDPGGPAELDVGASYPIDWFLFGKRAAAQASAARAISVSEAEYADLVRQRVLEATLGFFDVLEARALLEVANQNVQNLERMASVTRVAVENGGRPQVELNRIRLDLLIAQRAVRDARLGLVTAKANLRPLLGEGIADPAFDVRGHLNGPLTVEPRPLEEAYAAATQQRPDILALRQRIAQAEATVVAERRNAWPEVKTDWGLGHQFQREIGASDVTTWGTGLTVTAPIFNRNQGNRAKSVSVVRQSDQELQAGLLELRAEVVQAVESLGVAHQNATAIAQESLQLAAEVRDSINKAYAAGGRPLIDVLDAQRNYRETYQSYVTARADYWRSVYRYQATLGGQAPQ